MIITAKISHCQMKYTISPEKDILSQQITVMLYVNYTYKYD